MHIVPKREMTNTSISKQIKKEIIKNEKPKKEKKVKKKLRLPRNISLHKLKPKIEKRKKIKENINK